ncbi:MAG: hypothetical protein VXW17_06340 [Pseudomonadota bacterium]|nr:hypothetical protein [Pseudomonadota bacterium]
MPSDPAASMGEIDNHQQFLAEQTEAERASHYPYDAPEGGFVLDHGRLVKLRDPSILDGRVAVLSVGSNRAPVQLLRKFGGSAVVAGTPALQPECDKVQVALVSYYGAVPCTAFPSPGTDVKLNIAWLDDDQLQTMHRTEAVGIAYDYVRLFAGIVSHLPVLDAGGEIVPPASPVFGYSACGGVLDVGGGQPAGLARIPARNRRFQTLSQASAAALIHGLADDGRGDAATFVPRIVEDRSFRSAVNESLQRRAIDGDGPWKIQRVESGDFDAYL